MANKASILVISGELEKACVAFNIANAAAASGMEVVMFFTCWGINIVKKKGRLKGHMGMSRLINFMTGGGVERLPLSRFNFLGMGAWMMRRLMKAQNIQSIPEMRADAREMGVRFLVCDNPIAIMDLKREDLIDEVEDIVGVATYINESAGADLTLII